MLDPPLVINTDEYHRNERGILDIRPEKLNEGHIWARGKALQAMDKGVDPVIIDNTNMSWREMFPYVLMGFYRGYWIKFMLTKDTFRVSIDEIDRRCPNIPRWKLERMKNRYQSVQHVYQILRDRDCKREYGPSIDSWMP